MSSPPAIAGHPIVFDGGGALKPWAAWPDILARVMDFYGTCPAERGYPRFACETFLDADWRASSGRTDIIPATQNATGILSYLAYREQAGDADGRLLDTARGLGRYLVRETLTPADGAWPRFTRSTGRRGQFPQAPDSGAQSDRPYEIQPDKGGLAGYALARLWETEGSGEFLAQALHNARTLAAHQGAGEAARSPWPFRVDWRDGAARGPVSGNMSYILRLYDVLLAHGYTEFGAPRAALWEWVWQVQVPSAARDGALFAQFFEDHDTPTNRTAWAPLSLARYLLQGHGSTDPVRLAAVSVLLDFTEAHFTHLQYGIRVCHEQDEDRQPWNGVNCTYGAVLARYARATGSAAHARRARNALNFTLYCTDERGRPRDLFTSPAPGGWQEDAHTDVIHNVLDALAAYPEWAEPP